MELKKLLVGLENYRSKGSLEIDIKKVECNSKKIIPNSLFVAINLILMLKNFTKKWAG